MRFARLEENLNEMFLQRCRRRLAHTIGASLHQATKFQTPPRDSFWISRAPIGDYLLTRFGGEWSCGECADEIEHVGGLAREFHFLGGLASCTP